MITQALAPHPTSCSLLKHVVMCLHLNRPQESHDGEIMRSFPLCEKWRGQRRGRRYHRLPGKQLVVGPSWSSGLLYIWVSVTQLGSCVGSFSTQGKDFTALANGSLGWSNQSDFGNWQNLSSLYNHIKIWGDLGKFFHIQGRQETWRKSQIFDGERLTLSVHTLWEHFLCIRFYNRTDWVIASFRIRRCRGHGWMVLRKRGDS